MKHNLDTYKEMLANANCSKDLADLLRMMLNNEHKSLLVFLPTADGDYFKVKFDLSKGGYQKLISAYIWQNDLIICYGNKRNPILFDKLPYQTQKKIVARLIDQFVNENSYMPLLTYETVIGDN